MCKKWIILLVIAFTFQLSWTVASAFCQHETDQSTQHFGHHPHQHQTSDDEEQENKGGSKKSASHPDCATCHHGSSMAADLQVDSLKLPAVQYIYLLSQLQPAKPYLAQPERPKWMRLL
jgi:cytochrome c553